MAAIVFVIFTVVTIAVCLPAVILQLRRKSGGKSQDHLGTVIMYVTFIGACTIAFAGLWSSEAIRGGSLTGLALFCFGAGVRIAAFCALGTMYSGSVNLQTGHRLVQTGIYRLVRHPLHLGLILEIAGAALIAPTWAGVFCFILVFVFAVRRNRIEDRMLRARFGRAAVAYQSEIPGMNICSWLMRRQRHSPSMIDDSVIG